MIPSYLPVEDLAFLAHLLVFSAAALGCLAGAGQIYRAGLPGAGSPDVRHGLIALLSASGLWSAFHVGMLLSPTLLWKTAFYEIGLIVGFGTVFAWVWFCSAFSGRPLHRARRIQWSAAGVFALVTLTKLTNPWHGSYFSAEMVAAPFRHLEINHHAIYWITSALSYTLAVVGFFMLDRPLRKVKVGGGRLAGLFGLTALPLAANLIGYTTPWLLGLSYEPVGVAAFTLGVLVASRGRLEETYQMSRQEKPALVLSGAGQIQNHNRRAARLFPALEEEGATGRKLGEVLPDLRKTLSEKTLFKKTLSNKTLSNKTLSGRTVSEETPPNESGLEAPEKQVLKAEAPEASVGETEEETRYFRPVETTFRQGNGRLVVLTDVTERELRRQERASRIEAISSNMPGVAFEFRAGPVEERSVEFVGAEAEPLLGLSSEPEEPPSSSESIFPGVEDQYSRFLKRIPDSDRRRIAQSVEEAVRDQARWQEEFPFNRPDGEQIWLLGTAEPETEETPAREAVVFRGTLIDITERKRREQELRESRQELRREKRRIQSVTENVSDGIYRSTEEGIEYANSAFIEMFGYQDLQELRAAEPEAIYVNPGRREELIEKEHRDGHLRQEEVRYRRKDGSTFIGLLSSQQVEGEEGTRYFDGAITDITERKRQEETLRRRQAEIEALYEATRRLLQAETKGEVPGLLAGIIDDALGYPMTTIRFVEEGSLRPTCVLPAVRDSMPERPSYDLDGGSPAARAYRAGESQVYDDLSAEAEGLDRGDIRATAYVPIGSHGLISVGSLEAGGIGAFDRRLLEVLGAYAALVLSRLDREEELVEAKEQAEEARQEAEAASQAKSAFLANMSHEIRTPLTSIIGFAEVIGTQAEELNLPQESILPRYAGLIEKGGKRLLETLEGILNLSKLEAGQITLGNEPVNLAEQALEVAKGFETEAEEGGLELKVNAAETWAQADEGGVKIMLQNLLSNAIKYTEEGTIEVRARQEETQAVLEVEDTGIGMDASQAEDLFDPFRQESEGIARKYEGTGIGLAVTRKAAEEMGGQIEVKTRKGKGSCFTVRLPKASGALEEDPEENNQAENNPEKNSREENRKNGTRPEAGAENNDVSERT